MGLEVFEGGGLNWMLSYSQFKQLTFLRIVSQIFIKQNFISINLGDERFVSKLLFNYNQSWFN